MKTRFLFASLMAWASLAAMAQLIPDVIFFPSNNSPAQAVATVSWTDEGGTEKANGVIMTGEAILNILVTHPPRPEPSGRIHMMLASSLIAAVEVKTVAEPPLKTAGAFCGNVTGDGRTLHRLIVDKKSESYFGYDMSVEPGETSNSFRVSFQGLSNIEEMRGPCGPGTSLKLMPPPRYPPPQTVRLGETIAFDVLVSADGQQRVVDYLKIALTGDPPPAAPVSPPRDMTVDDERPRVTPDSVVRCAFFVNGKKTSNRIGFATGPGSLLWLYVPEHGRFFLALSPHSGFAKAGEIRDNTILIADADQRYELRLADPIAGSGAAWNLYVLHDPHYWPDTWHADAVIVGWARLVYQDVPGPPRSAPGPFGQPSFVSPSVMWKEFSIVPGPNGPGPEGRQSSFSVGTSGMRAKGITLRRALSGAYGLPEFRIFAADGGPDWFLTERYSITAQAYEAQDFQPLLQRELTRRFQLTKHWESREMTVYTLKTIEGVAPKLHPHTEPVDDFANAKHLTRTAGINLSNSVVGEFVHYLQQDVNGPVFDETGLAGRFDFFFTFESNSWSSNIDHIVPALKEQLGLELVESKRQLDVLVIDHAEKPEFP